MPLWHGGYLANLTPCPLAVAINVWAGRHVNQTSREEYGIATFGRINGRRFASPHVEDCELNASPAMKLLIAVALTAPLLITPSFVLADGRWVEALQTRCNC